VARQRFFFNLSLLAAAVLLIVAAVAFDPGTVKGIGLGIGIGSFAGALLFVSLLVHERRMEGYPELRLRGRRVGLWSVLGRRATAEPAGLSAPAGPVGAGASRALRRPASATPRGSAARARRRRR
jgi:hypothetical protein